MAQATTFLEMLQPLSTGRSTGLADQAALNALIAEATAKRDAAMQAADAMLAKARASAAQILDTARTEADTVREIAHQEGLAQGAQAAHDAAQIALRQEISEYQEGLRLEMQAIVDEIGTARQALWERQESEMLGFVLDIARQVIKTEVTQNQNVVLEVIKNALRRVTDKENIRIRVSIQDAPHVRDMRDDLMGVIDGLRSLEVIDDRRVGDGGCVIETNAGNIDAKLETQLREVERALGKDSDE